jgi:hypothetical protein
MSQEFLAFPGEIYTVEVTYGTIDGAARLFIGTSEGNNNILAEQTETTPDTYSYTVKPRYDRLTTYPGTLFLSIDTTGSTVGETVTVSRVSFKREDLSTNYWRIGAWSDDTGWPETCTFHQQRLWFMGSKDYPDSAWSSKLGDYEEMGFNTPFLDTDGIGIQLPTNHPNPIEWITSFSELVAGSISTEWRISGGTQSDAITPTTIATQDKSFSGSAAIQPVLADSSLIFVQRHGNVVKELPFSFEADSYKPRNISRLSNHMLDGNTIREWAYMSAPDTIIWAVRDDGVLLGITYEKEEDVVGWHRHTTNGTIESACVVPESGGDVLYLSVKRYINGAYVRYLEKYMPRITDADIFDYFFVDSGVTYNDPKTITGATKANPVVITIAGHGYSDDDLVDISGVVGMTELNGNRYKVANKDTNTFELTRYDTGDNIDGTGFTTYVSGGKSRKAKTTIDGLDHLEGEAVIGLSNGGVISGTVSSGEIELSVAGSLVHVGLAYTSDFETLPLEITGERGTSKGKLKNVIGVNVHYRKSRAAKIGSTSDDLETEKFLDESTGGAAPPLFTGTKYRPVNSTAEKEGRVFIRQDVPLPLSIMGVTPLVNYS